jgi:hypothetical protein
VVLRDLDLLLLEEGDDRIEEADDKDVLLIGRLLIFEFCFLFKASKSLRTL